MAEKLQRTNPQAFEQYENALRQFQDVESGVVEAGDIVKQMDEAHALNVQIQSEKAANAFINDLNPADMTAPIGIMANPTQTNGLRFLMHQMQ